MFLWPDFFCSFCDYQKLMRKKSNNTLSNHVAPKHPIATIEKIKNTKPGVPKFRLEWSFIQSPSAVNESNGSTSSTTVKGNEHDRYEIQIRNMEFSPTSLNNWIFFLHLKQNKIFRKIDTSVGTIDDMTDEQISSGFYWSYPGKAGLSIGLRYIDSKKYLNTKDGTVLATKYQVSSGRGNRLSIDYSF